MIPAIPAGTFAALFVALYIGHSVGDHWVQSSRDAGAKGGCGAAGRLACARHVASLTVTKIVAVAVLVVAGVVSLHPAALVLGLAVDAVSHYWADRRTTLARLAHLVGKGEFYRLGAPRPGRDDAPHLGTGAYALDQSWHLAWLGVAALIGSIGGA